MDGVYQVVNVQTKILDFVKANPLKTANEIAAGTGCKPATVKVLLHKLSARNQLAREKIAREVKTSQGPQKVFGYKIA